MQNTKTLKDAVDAAFSQRKQLAEWMASVIGPTSDRQLARAVRAHPITLRRTINDGADVESEKPYVHADRHTITERIGHAVPVMTGKQWAQLLRRAAIELDHKGDETDFADLASR